MSAGLFSESKYDGNLLAHRCRKHPIDDFWVGPYGTLWNEVRNLKLPTVDCCEPHSSLVNNRTAFVYADPHVELQIRDTGLCRSITQYLVLGTRSFPPGLGNIAVQIALENSIKFGWWRDVRLNMRPLDILQDRNVRRLASKRKR